MVPYLNWCQEDRSPLSRQPARRASPAPNHKPGPPSLAWVASTEMGRGRQTATSATGEVALRGEALAEAVRFERSAVDNYTRFVHGPETLTEARLDLREAIAADGQLSKAHPDWMTQDKPGVEMWLHLPGKISLELRANDDPGAGYRWTATNAIAPKSSVAAPASRARPSTRPSTQRRWRRSSFAARSLRMPSGSPFTAWSATPSASVARRPSITRSSWPDSRI